MKRFLLLAILLCLAATPATADITIEVTESKLEVKEPTQIFVSGLAIADLPTARVDVHPRKGTTLWTAQTWGSPPFIFFSSKQPGTYVVELEVPRSGPDGLWIEHVEAEIVVGDGGPQPNPPIPPVPPVPVPGDISMCVIFETETRTADETEMLVDLRAYLRTSDSKQKIPFADQHLKDGLTNEPAEWLKPYLKAVATRPVTLPALVVIAQTPPSKSTPSSNTAEASSVVAVESLTGLSGAEVIELVKKWGG